MKIKRLDISNYRSLDGLSFSFHSEVNFIVGLNNIGKSNLLKLLNTLVNKRNFIDEDFNDIEKSIEIKITLFLDEDEIGVFEDLFDPTNERQINIIALQENPDENITFIHAETETVISSSLIKKLNFIYYDSLRKPSNELNFNTKTGSGRFLSHLIDLYTKNDEKVQPEDLINNTYLAGLLDYINSKLELIETFEANDIKADTGNEIKEILSRLIILKNDENFPVDKLGYGIQFSNLVPISILERIFNIKRRKKTFENAIITDGNGTVTLPITLGLDEPEIHLHPHLQRKLIKYIYRITTNSQRNFNNLLSDLFGINSIKGQLFVVTHSPNILLDDYKHIVRIYKNSNGEVLVSSGVDIELDDDLEKHLNKHMQYIKEAFFSRTVIFVEGDSELLAIKVFAERMEIDLDDYEISVISAGSADSIPPLVDLFNKFGIETVSIIDGDKKEGDKFKNIKNLYITQGQDFEEDIYMYFNFSDYIRYLEEQYTDDPKKYLFFMGQAKKLGIDINPRQRPVYKELEKIDNGQNLERLKEELKSDVLNSLRGNKSILQGRLLSEAVTKIPQTYRDAIEKAMELSIYE
ncbi:ATP-dependent nuclease [Ureibacillus sp. FSL E2-3493]|jgi:putative ATP-dependent endonuclease of the OLD family|uniref:ATP-dependent nuclease n=1 Tax=Ureibacillus sp. FSL E2-3493 TaxID=2921367 RepID=UPI0031194C8E